MKNTLNEIEYKSFIQKQIHIFNQIRHNTELKHLSKINKLKEEHIIKLGITFNEDWFLNKTEIAFPEESRWLLSLGKKFALPIHRNNFSPIHIIADIEQCIQKIEDDKEKDIARHCVANRIQTYNRKIKNTIKEKFILKTYEKTQKIIRKHKGEIIITSADKGNKTVILYKEDYKNKMNEVLEDKNTYKIQRIDPTSKLQKTNNDIVSNLFKQKHIDLRLKNKLACSAASAPTLYGLPKTHKQNLPLRPISSSTNVPCYNLAKFIGETLQHIVSQNFNIRNAAHLKEKLNDVIIDADDILVSFDVISLFTNIPTYLAIKNIMNQWDKLKEQTNIPKPQFLNILQFCLKDNNYFKYDNKTYNQTFGMPMGNPLSPTIADIVLDNLLDATIEKLQKSNITVKFIAKYVDDIFAIIKKQHKDIILNNLNQYHEKLQFTIETENNKCIPYLDTIIHRLDDKIIFNWYQKPVASGRMINFLSTQPQKYKINTAKNLINKVLDISDPKFHKENITKIRTILLKNNFPHKIINDLINDKNNQIKYNNNNQKQTSGNADNIIFHSVRFIPKLTDNKNLHEILNINKEKTSFAHKSNHTLSKIFTRTKPPLQKEQQHDVVYEIKCKGKTNEVCDLVYIGTTKRTLATRIAEHQADVKKNRASTGLSQHMAEHGHTADFDDVRILDKERNTNKRFTLESLRIQQHIKRTMNFQEDKDNLSSSYSAVIK